MKKAERKGSWRDFFNLIRKTKPSKTLLVTVLTLSLLTTSVSLVIPLFIKSFVDNFSVDSMDMVAITFLLLAFVVQAVSDGFTMYLLNYIGQDVVAKIRKQLWKKYLYLPVKHYDDNHTGEMISRMINDTGIIRALITYNFSTFFTGLILTIGSVAILMIIDWKMTLLMMITVPVTLLIVIPLGKKMHSISRNFQNEAANFTHILSQVLSEIRLVKASVVEKLEYEKGSKGINNLFKYGLREGIVMSLIYPLNSFIYIIFLICIIGYGGVRVSSGALSPGELVAFILYLVQMIGPMSRFTEFFAQLQKTKGATERIISRLNLPEEDNTQGLTEIDAHQKLSFTDISFSYHEDEVILKKIDFSIEPGRITAIVGPSGAGKSTIFSLIERFYEPTDGKIELGETKISEYALNVWRSQIGYVSQESAIISGTIKENIIYGVPFEVKDEEIERAAKMAFADQFIKELPNKYDTQVGERGVKLSGGQRQRIGIARALLRNPKILMLDEATSSLDSKSEIYVQRALENLMKGRTTLVIAHRLSTIIDADQILFIEDGMITGAGTHAELFENHPMYHEFAIQQLGEKNVELTSV